MAAPTVTGRPGTSKRAASTNYTVESVARAVVLLGAFERPPHHFGVSDLARQLGQTKNLVFRLLRTLEAQGFVMRVDGPSSARSPHYAIGVRLFDLSRHAVDRQELLRSAAHPYLEEVKRETAETSYLVVLDDDLGCVCVDLVESDFVVRNVLGIGNRLPLFAGGGGKALLAFQPVEVQDRVIAQHVRALTAFTPTTAADVHRNLAAIRREGYWIALEEFTEGADAVGAAVFDARGKAVAGLGIAGPTRRMRDRLDSPQQRWELVQPIVDAAIGISRRLGYQGPYPPLVEAAAQE